MKEHFFLNFCHFLRISFSLPANGSQIICFGFWHLHISIFIVLCVGISAFLFPPPLLCWCTTGTTHCVQINLLVKELTSYQYKTEYEWKRKHENISENERATWPLTMAIVSLSNFRLLSVHFVVSLSLAHMRIHFHCNFTDSFKQQCIVIQSGSQVRCIV